MGGSFFVAPCFAKEKENVEVRAQRVCGGIVKQQSNFRGTLKVDNLTIQGDGNGDVTIKRDGVDLGLIEKGSYEKYIDCLTRVIELISPNREHGLPPSAERQTPPPPRPAPDLTGTWRGEVVQPGGPIPSYIVELQLFQTGDAVSGWSRFVVGRDAGRWAVAAIESTTATNVVRATLSRHGSPPVPGGYWCRSAEITLVPQSRGQLSVWGQPDSGCLPWHGTLARIGN